MLKSPCPPNHLETVGRIVFRLTDLTGETIGEFAATRKTIESEGNFVSARADWPVDIAPPRRPPCDCNRV